MKITPEVQQIFTLTTQMENNARSAAAAAYKEARALAEKTKNEATLKQIDAIAPVQAEPPAGGGGRGGRGGRGGAAAAGPAAPPTLATIGAQLIAAVQPMQGSEMPPPPPK